MRVPRIPLLWRVAATLAAVGLLPLAITSLQIEINRDAFLDQVQRSHIMSASAAARLVNVRLEAWRLLAELLASNPVLMADPRSTSGRDLLTQVLVAVPEVAAVGLFNDAGEQVVLAQRSSAKDEIATVLHPEARQELRLVDSSSRRWLRLQEPLAGGAGRLILLVEASPLQEALAHANSLLGPTADLVLASQEGRVLLGSHVALEDFPAQVVQYATNGNLGEGAAKWRQGEEEVVVAHYKVGDGRWFVLSHQRADQAEVALTKMRQGTWFGIALALLLTASLSIVAYRAVVVPIRRMTRTQQELAGMEPAAKGRSEIEELEAACASLEERIRAQQELGEVFLGRYQVVEVAGTGSMGTVFRGWDPRLQRAVALKTVNFDIAKVDREALSQQLLTEAVVSARLNHANVVTVYDTLVGRTSTCIAMEFIDGISLETYLWHHAPLPQDQVIPLGAAMARALAAAHHEGLVHHDVKPSNVLLGHEPSIKVTDFGISQLVTQAAKDRDSICGTAGYLPPESLTGDGYSPLSDLFSLGVVLYYCLTARHPFLEADLRKTLIKTLRNEPESVEQFNPQVEPELSRLVMELMSKDPEDRPPTATSVAETLEAMARAEGLSWRPASILGRTPPARSSAGMRTEPGLLGPTRLIDLDEMGLTRAERRRYA